MSAWSCPANLLPAGPVPALSDGAFRGALVGCVALAVLAPGMREAPWQDLLVAAPR